MPGLRTLFCALSLCAGVLLALPAASQQDDRPTIASMMKAYENSEGVQVWTLRVGPPAVREALVRINGIDHGWNNRIQKMRVERCADGVRYWLEVNQSRLLVLALDNGYGELYLPGESQAIDVSYDPMLSGRVNPDHFLSDYLEQDEP